MTFKVEDILTLVFYGVVSYSAFDLASSVKKTKNSIEELNIKIAQILENISWHEKQIEDHSERLRTLETKE